MNKKYRKAIIVGNWKMNMLPSEVKGYVAQLRALLPRQKTCDIAVCAPYVAIPALIRAARDTRLGIGAQDVSAHAAGAYTGEVSAAMLADLGLKYCIAGHSECRRYHNERSHNVNEKVVALVGAGITPIVCVGETEIERSRSLTLDHISYQVKAALADLTSAQVRRCVIAYEPIWAIGNGKTATAGQAQEICCHIRSVIRKEYGARIARAVCILYGGSMNADNAAELLAMPDIDGGLIGSASLRPEEFAKIIAATAQEDTEA